MAWLSCLVACDRLFSTEDPFVDASPIDAGADAEPPADADTSGCLRDTFHDAEIDLGKWHVVDLDNMPVVITEENQHLVVALAGDDAANVLIGRTSRDVTNGSAIVEVVQQITAGGENFLVLEQDPANLYAIKAAEGSIRFSMFFEGSDTGTNLALPYDETQFRFWRIRHDGMNVQFETSDLGVQWTSRYSVPPQVALSPVTVGIGARSAADGAASPGAAIFDNFQLVTTGCPYLP